MTSALRPLLLAFILSLLAGSAFAGDETPTWRPITPAELQMKAPLVEADADAEAIFWEVWLDDKKESSMYWEHYVRVKIFTARGQERFSKLDIPFSKGQKVENIAARVIRPDGTILNLDPKDIFEREIVKAGKVKVMAKSFAIPAIEPGVIVEYKYRETFKDAWGNGIRLNFQHDIPIQKIAYHIRPQKGYRLVTNFFNMQSMALVEDPAEKGFFLLESSNAPAFKVEPNMPPEDDVKRWALVGYTIRDGAIWNSFYRRYADWLKTYSSSTDLIKRKAAELTAGASTDDEKLQRIYDYIQKDIKNVDFDRKLTEDEREKLEIEHSQGVIIHGMANSIYIELLFAALVQASGFEVNLAFTGNRSVALFSPDRYPVSSYIRLGGVAVKVNMEWKYFNVSVPYLPFGYVSWFEEGVVAMLIGQGGFIWRSIPVSSPLDSLARRTATFSIAEDGTLEGRVKLEYSGQQGVARRAEMYRLSDAERKEKIGEDLKERISTVEVSDVLIENFRETSKPLTYNYKIRVPNYAQRTGQRLFLQPSFFEYGVKPLFSATTRKHNIHFAYPWSESDEIDIKLPEGFDSEAADQPSALSDPKKIGSLRIGVSINKTTNTIKYKRDFHFGGGKTFLFPATSYAGIKGLFDAFNRADSHVVTLKARK